MDFLNTFVPIVYLGLVIIVPFVAVFVCGKLNLTARFIWVNLISLPILFVLLLLLAYWPHFYADTKLQMMGYDTWGTNETERAMNVAPELRDEAGKLYWSNMGIGWPLRAMFGFVFYASWYPSAAWLTVKTVKWVFKPR